MSNFEIRGDGSNLSIEETNKIRLQLGLTPLTEEVEDAVLQKKDYVHQPALNISEKQDEEKAKNKLTKHREDRELLLEMKSIKPITADPIEALDIDALVKKVKEKQMREEMESSSEDEVPMETDGPGYTGEDLAGLTVEHSASRFDSFMPTILTLKDSNVLDKDSGDVLVNVNFMDYERAEQNVKNKKAGVHYHPTESDDEDDLEMKPPSMLAKYNEKETKRFVIGSAGNYNLDTDNREMAMQTRFTGVKINLQEKELQMASNFYTEEELNERLRKKGKRKAKSTRTNTKISTFKTESELQDVKPKEEEGELIDEDNSSKSSSKRAKNIASLPVAKQTTKPQIDSDEDDIRPALVFTELKPVTLFNTKLRNELESFKRSKNKPAPKKVDHTLYNGASDDADDAVPHPGGLKISFAASCNEQVFNKLKAQQEMDALRAARIKEEPVVAPVQLTPVKKVKTNNEIVEHAAQSSGWQPEDKAASPPKIERKRSSKPACSLSPPAAKKQVQLTGGILGDEIQLNQGVFSALLLARQKGYLDQPKEETMISNAKSNTLKAKHFYEEKIRYEDIDAKAPRRERYTGPVTTFQDKKDFNPEIKLEYNDEFGRAQEPKEAFRTLSHRFHGKSSGKIKSQKRVSRYKKEMEQGAVVGDVAMRSVDKQYSKMKEDKKFCVPLSGKNAIIPSTLKKPEKKLPEKKDKSSPK